jgi:transposase
VTRNARWLSHKGVPSGRLDGIRAVPQNFIECDREQGFLIPPSLRDWLPADHLAWFVIESVERLDLMAFYAAYRPDGHGRGAYEPSMMVSLVLYVYSTNVRSSRAIERHCRQDIAYRVITGNRVPDHATIARFIVRHERRLAELFTSVLRLCAKAGLVKSGVVAVDGTKLSASANSDSNLDYDRVAREIIAEAIATDAAEDEQYGDARGDELPPELSTEAARREWLTRVLDEERSAEAEADENARVEEESDDPLDGFDAERILGPGAGPAGVASRGASAAGTGALGDSRSASAVSVGAATHRRSPTRRDPRGRTARQPCV